MRTTIRWALAGVALLLAGCAVCLQPPTQLTSIAIVVAIAAAAGGVALTSGRATPLAEPRVLPTFEFLPPAVPRRFVDPVFLGDGVEVGAVRRMLGGMLPADWKDLLAGILQIIDGIQATSDPTTIPDPGKAWQKVIRSPQLTEAGTAFFRRYPRVHVRPLGTRWTVAVLWPAPDISAPRVRIAWLDVPNGTYTTYSVLNIQFDDDHQLPRLYGAARKDLPMNDPKHDPIRAAARGAVAKLFKLGTGSLQGWTALPPVPEDIDEQALRALPECANLAPAATAWRCILAAALGGTEPIFLPPDVVARAIGGSHTRGAAVPCELFPGVPEGQPGDWAIGLTPDRFIVATRGVNGGDEHPARGCCVVGYLLPEFPAPSSDFDDHLPPGTSAGAARRQRITVGVITLITAVAVTALVAALVLLR